MASRAPIFGLARPPDDRHALGGADQIQPEAPEEPGVGSAVAAAGVSGEIKSLHRLPGLAAWQRGGVQQAQILSPCRDVLRDGGNHGGDQPGLVAEPLAEAGLTGQVREHAGQVLLCVPDPFALRGNHKQVLGRGQTQQFRITQGWLSSRDPGTRPAQTGQDMIIQVDVKCGQEGVKVGFHTQGLTPSAFD